MVGLIQKLLLDFVTLRGGPRAVEQVKRRAGISPEQTYRLGVPYSDEECRRLFSAAEEVLELSRPQLIEAYAEYFCRDSIERWPTWWQMSRCAREMLERQPVIHNCFATGVQDPQVRKGITDKFALERRGEQLVAHYRSPNKMCDLYVALIHQVLRHYGEHASVAETRCVHRGDPECEIHIRFQPEDCAR